jgi:ribosome biogenesis protein Tsr3
MDRSATGGDAGRESLLSYFDLKDPEDLRCENRKKIVKMCINPGCQTQALVCQEHEQCLSCSKLSHITCDWALASDLTKRLSKQSERQKSFIKMTEEVESGFLDQLGKIRETLFKHYRFGNL